MEKNNDVLKDSFKSFLGFSYGPFVNAIIGVLSVPLVTYSIIPEELGYFALYTSLLNLIGMFKGFNRKP